MYVTRTLVALHSKPTTGRAELRISVAFLAGLLAFGCRDGTPPSQPPETIGGSDAGGEAGSSGGTDQAGSSGSSPAAGSGGSSAGSGGSSPAAGSGGSSAGSGGSSAAGSGGSSAAACTAPAVSAGDFTKMLSYGGVDREYLLHVPPSYDGKTAVPLVIDIHGYTYTDTDQADTSGWREKSDTAGFIVVHPSGLDNSWNGGSLCCGTSQETGVDDEGFMRALVKQMREDACIDAKRVYATGLSNGGALSYLLACRSGDVFAAAAPVSMGNGTSPCDPVRPISMIMYRGLKDESVPYEGGNTYPSAMSDLDQWKTLDSCTGTPQKLNGVCDQYTQCSGGVEVMLCSIPNGTHILYSDAAKAGAAVADVAWAAFKRHTLP